MRSRHIIRVSCMLSLVCLALTASARNHVVTIKGGEVHLRGALDEGACTVSTDSEDMHVEMGQYRTADFNGAASEASFRVPFTVHLTDCNPALATGVGISFYGMTDPNDPNVFQVSSGVGVPMDVRGTGVGLVISDEQGRVVHPNTVSENSYRIEGSDVLMQFTAHYRATSRTLSPGALRSDVWFSIDYP